MHVTYSMQNPQPMHNDYNIYSLAFVPIASQTASFMWAMAKPFFSLLIRGYKQCMYVLAAIHILQTDYIILYMPCLTLSPCNASGSIYNVCALHIYSKVYEIQLLHSALICWTCVYEYKIEAIINGGKHSPCAFMCVHISSITLHSFHNQTCQRSFRSHAVMYIAKEEAKKPNINVY